VGTEQLGEESWDKTVQIRQRGQDSMDRKLVGIGQPEWTYGTEQPKESQDSTAWTELLGHDSNDRTDGTKQLSLHN
jgi:hypothetical protein